MQTFLPYPDYMESMKCLDPKRLGNQVYRECVTLINGGWPNHPASLMWRGYEYQLAKYALAGLIELEQRGLTYPRWFQFFMNCLIRFPETPEPPWLGREDFHSSHRAALLYKDFDYYSQFGWSEDPAIPDNKGRLPYVWPVTKQDLKGSIHV